MPYVEGQTVHDADSHVMELPNTLETYIQPAYREALRAVWRRAQKDDSWVPEARALQQDPDFRAAAPENLWLRKNYQAMGAFTAADRPQALDLFGFASQLVFTTAGLSLFELEHGEDPELAIAAARAHNRMNTEFCAVDKRLLATGYVPLVDRARAADVAREAIELGCKGLMIPSWVPRHHSPSHIDFEPLWALAQEAKLPILFHVGGEKKMEPAYFENGLPRVLDFHGGAENFTSLSFMAIPMSIWQTLSALVFDGVFDRYPDLKFGAIELGASWVPSLMQFMDSGAAAFHREERIQKLSAKPSEILKRQFFATPYPHENVGWIIGNVGEDICLFSSDYPHIEGGRNPLKRFNESLEGTGDRAKRRFYRDNFIEMMGAGLDPALHDAPHAVAA
jgi:predicted TIM-barrel fold metal-dependent hydrolase